MASPTLIGKRKRTSIGMENTSQQRPSHLPADSINPFSRSPAQLFQFSVAGLSDTDEDPSVLVSWFPHRALGRELLPNEVDSDEDPEPGTASEGDSDPAGARRRHKKRAASQREKHLFVLLQSLHHFLDHGQIAKAARSYGLILQLQVHGRPVDIRHHNLWATGAEILMRGGEEESIGAPAHPRRERWGSAANMGRVKAYFEALIQQYPYDSRHPRNVCALDFWLALISCDIYNAHAEHMIALQNSDTNAPAPDTGTAEPRSPEHFKDSIRLRALKAMTEITDQMDRLGQEQPYSKNQQFLELRVTASLYTADLMLPAVEVSPLDSNVAQGNRLSEQNKARDYLEKILDLGGQLSPAAVAFLSTGSHSLDEGTSQMRSKLPIR